MPRQTESVRAGVPAAAERKVQREDPAGTMTIPRNERMPNAAPGVRTCCAKPIVTRLGAPEPAGPRLAHRAHRMFSDQARAAQDSIADTGFARWLRKPWVLIPCEYLFHRINKVPGLNS
jgi:hypothetical protein